MPVADFLDSNVLVYVFDTRDAQKHALANELFARAQQESSAVISFQVVQETLNVLTQKLRPKMSVADARATLEAILTPLWQVMPSPALYARALVVQERYGYGFYDSLIIATALEAGCKRLLSEDLQHGQKIENLRIENPFRQAQ